jgi:hypothetical protein
MLCSVFIRICSQNTVFIKALHEIDIFKAKLIFLFPVHVQLATCNMKGATGYIYVGLLLSIFFVSSIPAEAHTCTAIVGGYMQCYSNEYLSAAEVTYKVTSPGSICCQGAGTLKGRLFWEDLGCGTNPSGTAIWEDTNGGSEMLVNPSIKCKASGTVEVDYQWSHVPSL